MVGMWGNPVWGEKGVEDWTQGLVSTRQGLPELPDSGSRFQCAGELPPSTSSSLMLREVFRFILRFLSLEDKLHHKPLASPFPILLSSTCIYIRNRGEITVFWLHFYGSGSIVYSISFLQSLVYPGVNGRPIFGASWFSCIYHPFTGRFTLRSVALRVAQGGR